MRTTPLLLLCLFTTTLQATTLLFGATSPSQLLNDVKGGLGYQCNQQPITWCIDELTYYRESAYTEVVELEGKFELSLMFEFTAHRLSELQLNLRKDGLVLQRVEIEGKHFDVKGELAKTANQAERSQVDKQLIEFLNRFPQQAPRTLEWQSQRWRAALTSDGELISLKFHGGIE